jgi:hypothetical protein
MYWRDTVLDVTTLLSALTTLLFALAGIVKLLKRRHPQSQTPTVPDALKWLVRALVIMAIAALIGVLVLLT